MKSCPACGGAFAAPHWVCPSCGHTPQRLQGFTSFAPALSETTENYDAARYAAVAAVEGSHFWFRGRNDLVAWALGQYFPAADSLLEVGCGTGQVLARLYASKPDLRLVGTEIHVRGLDLARRRLPEAEFLQMDARAIPFVEEFAVVCAFDVLEHLAEDTAVLAQMFRACRSGGGLLLTVPQHRWLWSHKDDFAHHKRRYSRKELADKVIRAGFQVVKATSFVSLLLPLLYVSRLREQAPTRFDPQRELTVNPVVNRSLLALMRWEGALIRGGISLPAGGSLLLVARKP